MPGPAEIPVAILCGGRGTRLQEHTREIPKALVEIGGEPILWHVMRIYAAQGFRSFRLLTGYRGQMIADWLASSELPDGIEASCVETGEDTPTGGRILLARDGDRRRALLRDLCGRPRRHRSRLAARQPRAQRRGGDDDGHPPPQPVGNRPHRRGRADRRLRGEAEGRLLGQRRILLFRAGVLRLSAARQRSRAGAALGRRRRQRPQRIPPRGLLGVHGHLQGLDPAQRPLGVGRPALERLAPGRPDGVSALKGSDPE